VVPASGPLQENENALRKGQPPTLKLLKTPFFGNYESVTEPGGFCGLEFTLANHAPSRNDLARRWLAGVSLLAGIALGGRCGRLADERFLFHGHCCVSRLYLAVLRNTVEQADGQTRRGYQTICKPLETMRWRIRLDTGASTIHYSAQGGGLIFNLCGLNN
jgi:hypothetical protein